MTIIIFNESTFPSAHDTVELQKPVFLLHSYQKSLLIHLFPSFKQGLILMKSNKNPGSWLPLCIILLPKK